MQTQELGAGAIAAKDRLTLAEVSFVVARIIGYTQAEAYKLIKPKVTDKSASVLGAQWNGRLRDTIARTTLTEALAALGDVVAVELALNRDSPDRLNAAKELNKVAGRYRDTVEASDLATLLHALAPQAPKEAEPLSELERIVDLRRPRGEGTRGTGT